MTGQAAPAPAATPAAAAPATPAPAAAPATPAPAAPVAPAPAAPEANSWLAGAPEDIAAYVTTKGWKDPATAIESYRQLEKHMGVPADKLLRLPDFDKAEKADLDAFYGKLGRPANAADYQVKLPENASEANKASVEFLKSAYHELGLNQKQAAALTDKLFQNQATQQEAARNAVQAKFSEAEEALKRSWGAAYEKNQTVAKNAAEAFGLDQADLDTLKAILGAKATEFLYTVGSKMGEDQFVGQGTNNGFGTMTPAQAREEIKRLQSDSEFVAKYLGGNTETRTRMAQLHQWASAGAG